MDLKRITKRPKNDGDYERDWQHHANAFQAGAGRKKSKISAS